MSVEFEPKSSECFSFGVSNGTWFALLNEAGLGEILPPSNTNDPIDADNSTALKCAAKIKDWTPAEGWFREGGEQEGKAMFIEFFVSCGGFDTR